MWAQPYGKTDLEAGARPLYPMMLESPQLRWAFIPLLPMYYYHQKHPVNYFLLGIFTISLAFAVGLTCAFTEGKVILESAILTTVVVVSLTMYTFWAARRGHDFNFLGPFLFGAVMVLMVFAFIQLFDHSTITFYLRMLSIFVQTPAFTFVPSIPSILKHNRKQFQPSREVYFAFCHHNFCGRGLSHSVHFLGGKETEVMISASLGPSCLLP
ncbi:hypothetical protein D5086_004448 [Populus alba]|uniref:Uncharacterized protein n=1 Tax=Populus alba TaxID=43335 RepID=A0ACC4CQF5_POPAL